MVKLRTYPLIFVSSLLILAGCRTIPVYPLTGLLSSPAPASRILFLAVSAQFSSHSYDQNTELPKMIYVWHKAGNGRLKEPLLDKMPTDKIVCIVTYAGGSCQFLPVHLPLAPHLAPSADDVHHTHVAAATSQPLEVLLRINLADSTRQLTLVGRHKRSYKALLSLNVL